MRLWHTINRTLHESLVGLRTPLLDPGLRSQDIMRTLKPGIHLLKKTDLVLEFNTAGFREAFKSEWNRHGGFGVEVFEDTRF
jgi:hypothetical protein